MIRTDLMSVDERDAYYRIREKYPELVRRAQELYSHGFDVWTIVRMLMGEGNAEEDVCGIVWYICQFVS